MPREGLMAIVIALLVVFLLLMADSWRRRRRRQADVAEPARAPEEYRVLARAGGLYLSTTPVGEPLNRIAVRGLGFRARFEVIVADSGIILPIPGETTVFIPWSAVRSIGTASWTIDRGVEPRGLTVVTWTLGASVLDSYFRFDEPADFEAAAAQLLATTGSDTQ